MKTIKLLLVLWVLCLPFIFIESHAQQPKPETIYKLNPEASKAMAALFQDMQTEADRHAVEVKRISDLEAAIMKGAGIPQSEWDKRQFKVEADGTLSFVPKPAETAKVPK
jgi:hypothetical protein